MDTTLLAGIIQALATLCGCSCTVTATLLAVFAAGWFARNELRERRKETTLATYENLVNAERSLFTMLLSDDEATKELLDHFGMKEVPDDPSERRNLLGALLQMMTYESLFYRHKKDFFPKELWKQWDHSMANSFRHSKNFRDLWEKTNVREVLWKDFSDHVEYEYFASSEQ